MSWSIQVAHDLADTEHGSTNAGPHNSNAANKLDVSLPVQTPATRQLLTFRSHASILTLTTARTRAVALVVTNTALWEDHTLALPSALLALELLNQPLVHTTQIS